MANAILDEKFFSQTSETEGEIAAYSDLLDRMVSSCPDANVVLESQQWSRIAAIQSGATIYSRDEVSGETLPFYPSDCHVQVAYYWDRSNEQWDVAFVATFENE